MRTSAHRTLRRLTAQLEPSIRDAFLRSVQDIVDRAILSELIRAIADGDIVRAISAIGLSPAAYNDLVRTIERAFETGGITTASTFPRTVAGPISRTVFRFDVRNSRAEAWLRDHSSQLVTAITEDARAVVRQTIQQGMVDGVNPRTTALDLVGRIDRKTGQRVGGKIGLTPGQNRWVDATRRDLARINVLISERKYLLRADDKRFAEKVLNQIQSNPYFNRALRGKGFDDVILQAARSGTPLDSATIDRLVTQYKSNALRYRGEVIGRTEAISALNQSEHEAINQAVDSGAVNQSAVKRVWDSAGDDGRTRESHLEMDGQTVGLNEPFTFPDGSKAMFPGDTSLGAPAEETIQCRCVARTEIDWLAGARDVVTEEERLALLAGG